MARYLLLYRLSAAARDAHSSSPVEQNSHGTVGWVEWFASAGPAILDGGSPVAGEDSSLGGFSIVEAKDHVELDTLLKEHPHRAIGTIEIFEFSPSTSA